ncbi:hypothetical protein [Vibrio anguillarum]|uniref:hypothetical protein n=1 Tax=Vibrio anguillarum TaxID=55601 RepID=UPI0002E32A17|nr:hypothetical protein [Vibrio anguillarum]OEE41238.1 hypothetical protein A1QU_05535 [Vibrio anguillarum]
MSELIKFKPKHEFEHKLNLADFIELCKAYPHLPPAKSSQDEYNYVSAYWTGVVNFTKLGVNARKRGKEYELDDSIMPFAKAYFTYQQSHAPTKPKNESKALRVIEQTLLQTHGTVDITQLKPATLDKAAQLARESYAPQAAYHCGVKLEVMCRFLCENKIVKKFTWKNPVKRGEDTVEKVGEKGKEYREKKLPSDDALVAIAEVFSLGEESLSSRDIFTTSCIALLLAAPARGSELFYLNADCIEVVKDAKGKKQLGLRWFSGKGYGYEVEWVPECMWDVVQEAVERLRKLSSDARIFAKSVEEKANFIPCPADITLNEKLTREQVSLALGLDVSLFEEYAEVKGEAVVKTGLKTKKGQTSSNQLLKKYGIARKHYEVTMTELNDVVREKLKENGFPFIAFKAGDGIKVKWSDALFAQMVNAFHDIKSTSTTELWMPTIGTINEDLAATKKKTKDGSSMANQRSLFERHGYISMKVLSHQLRHLLNTMAKVGRMSDTLLTRWSGRADPKQTRVYNHQTPEQLNTKVRSIKQTNSNHSSLGITEFVVATPETLQEINADANITAHVTEFGVCIHSYVLNPCEKHRDCVNCEEQVCEKGDGEKLQRLKNKLAHEEFLLSGDQQAVDSGLVNAEAFVKKRLLTIERCKGLIEKLEDDSIPDGSLIKLAIDKASRLDKALDINGKERLPKLEAPKKEVSSSGTAEQMRTRPKALERLKALGGVKRG